MQNKLKIVYILPFYDEGTNTHLFYNYELVKHVAKRGDVELFVIVEKIDITLFGDRKKVSYALGVPVYVQKFSFPPLRFLELIWKCFMLRVSGHMNFYVHYSYYGALAAWLVSWFKLWTSDVHSDVGRPEIKIFYWNRGMPWLFKRGLFGEKVFKFILRHTILVTGPELLAKEYQKHYGVKEYRVLSNWVDTARFAPKSNAKDQMSKVVLFVHHLSKRKGADLVPEIANGFGDDVLFLMIGEGPEKRNLESGIENLELGEKIKLLGQISNSEIPNYFQMAEVFLMPSREEGSPHVLLEAMASGLPFVASDIGGVKELISKPLGELVCPSEDIACFQAKIRKLLSDAEFYNKMRLECLSQAKNFDISRGVEEFVNLFKR